MRPLVLPKYSPASVPCPLPIDADVQDELVSLTSHLPHVLASALTNYVLGHAHGDAVLPFLAGGFRDSTRVAAANPAMVA